MPTERPMIALADPWSGCGSAVGGIPALGGQRGEEQSRSALGRGMPDQKPQGSSNECIVQVVPSRCRAGQGHRGRPGIPERPDAGHGPTRRGGDRKRRSRVPAGKAVLPGRVRPLLRNDELQDAGGQKARAERIGRPQAPAFRPERILLPDEQVGHRQRCHNEGPVPEVRACLHRSLVAKHTRIPQDLPAHYGGDCEGRTQGRPQTFRRPARAQADRLGRAPRNPRSRSRGTRKNRNSTRQPSRR